MTAVGGPPTSTTPVAAPPPSRLRRLAGPALVVGTVALGAAYVGLVDPGTPGHYPLCPTKYLTGLDCPFCGGLRATHALVHGDLVGALDHNALLVLVGLPLALVVLVRWTLRLWRGEPPPPPGSTWLSRPAVLWGLLGLALAFTVLRNIDAVPALAWLGSGA